MKKQRRHFGGTEKVAILEQHLVEKVPVSDLCDQHDLYPNQFYGWLKDFFENGHAAFDNGRKTKAVEDAKDKKIQQLEATLTRKNEVMAELMEAHTELKKVLGKPEVMNWCDTIGLASSLRSPRRESHRPCSASA